MKIETTIAAIKNGTRFFPMHLLDAVELAADLNEVGYDAQASRDGVTVLGYLTTDREGKIVKVNPP